MKDKHIQEQLIRITALAVLLLCLYRCNAQEADLFHFNTSAIVMVDTTGEMSAGGASWRVRAWADTLQCGPLVWYGIKWEHTDSGLFFLSPFFQASYLSGPGGQSLLVKPQGSIKIIELYEKVRQ